jgi:hypothetical protein
MVGKMFAYLKKGKGKVGNPRLLEILCPVIGELEELTWELAWELNPGR